MSIHWTLVAGFLYAEIGVILLLLVPFISSKMWNKIFRSRLMRGVETQLLYYFYVLVAILILLFLDSIREMQKYSSDEYQVHGTRMMASHLDTQMQMQMRLFRAQRNFFIAGFALFLLLVIKKLVSLTSANAGLQSARLAAVKQAESARRAAEDILESEGGNDNQGDEAKKMKAAMEEAKKEAEAAKREVSVLKRQSEGVAREYDRLMEVKDRADRENKTGGSKKTMFGWKK